MAPVLERVELKIKVEVEPARKQSVAKDLVLSTASSVLNGCRELLQKFFTTWGQ